MVPHIHTYDMSCKPVFFFVTFVSIALVIAAAMVTSVSENRPMKAIFFRMSMCTFQSRVTGMTVTAEGFQVSEYESFE